MSFRCYDNSDVIVTLIITNLHLYLTQLWWQFFCLCRRSLWSNLAGIDPEKLYRVEPLSYAITAYVVASYGPRFFSTVLKKSGQLARFLGANGLPPPLPSPGKKLPVRLWS